MALVNSVLVPPLLAHVCTSKNERHSPYPEMLETNYDRPIFLISVQYTIFLMTSDFQKFLKPRDM